MQDSLNYSLSVVAGRLRLLVTTGIKKVDLVFEFRNLNLPIRSFAILIRFCTGNLHPALTQISTPSDIFTNQLKPERSVSYHQ